MLNVTPFNLLPPGLPLDIVLPEASTAAAPIFDAATEAAPPALSFEALMSARMQVAVAPASDASDGQSTYVGDSDVEERVDSELAPMPASPPVQIAPVAVASVPHVPSIFEHIPLSPPVQASPGPAATEDRADLRPAPLQTQPSLRAANFPSVEQSLPNASPMAAQEVSPSVRALLTKKPVLEPSAPEVPDERPLRFSEGARPVAPLTRAAKLESAVEQPPLDAKPPVQVLPSPAPALPPVTAPTAIASPPVIAELAPAPRELLSPERWIAQLANELAARTGDDGRISFRLSPENLGQLEVAVTRGDDSFAVEMRADSDEAQAIITASLPRLEQELRAKMRVPVEAQMASNPGSSEQGSRQQRLPNALAGPAPEHFTHDRKSTRHQSIGLFA